jgi:PBP1b-binding outer membrane lipoprotein LpoB
MKQTTKLLLVTLALVGCETPAVYVDPNTGAGVVSVDQINVQDFALAADGMLQSLYDSPAFTGKVARDGGAPNETASNFDTDLLVTKLTVSITRSGKARVAKAIGITEPVDAVAAEARKGAPTLSPDYTLSGKIIETRAKAGKVRQATYTFQLALTDVKTGLSVWEEEKAVTKQGSKSSVGF